MIEASPNLSIRALQSLDVLVIILGCLREIAQTRQNVCNGAIHILISSVISHLLRYFQHPLQMLYGPLRLILQ